MRILLVEDEKRIAEAIAQLLKVYNYSVDVAHDGEYGLDCALSNIYDIIALDIMLPLKDGICVLRELRDNGIKTPVILLTAKGSLEDKVLGLDSGADDYLAKPFQTEELLARIRALSRRQAEYFVNGILKYGNIELHTDDLSVRCGSQQIKLKLKESQLLELLIKNQTQTITKDYIIEKLWGYDSEAEDSHVATHVSLLRKKILVLSDRVSIQAIRNVGYRLHKEE